MTGLQSLAQDIAHGEHTVVIGIVVDGWQWCFLPPPLPNSWPSLHAHPLSFVPFLSDCDLLWPMSYLLADMTPTPLSKNTCNFPLPISCSSALARRQGPPVGRCDLSCRAESAQTKPSRISGEPASSRHVCSSASMELPRYPWLAVEAGVGPAQDSQAQQPRSAEPYRPLSQTHISYCMHPSFCGCNQYYCGNNEYR